MSLGSDGSIVISTKLDNTGLTSGIGRLGASLKKLAGVVGLAFGAAAIVSFGKAALDAASDLQEVQNVVDTAFGDMAYKAEQFASTSIERFGMSEVAAKRAASTYMAMGKSMGLSMGAASDMAVAVAGLTGDVASFYNISQDLASIKLKGIWTGETEALKDLGVVMTEANLKEFALSKGITKNYQAMSQAEKVTLRYMYVSQTLSDAQGDFARTSTSYANQTRILAERFTQLKIAIGNALLPIARAVLPGINAVIAGLTRLANVFAQVTALLFGKEAPQQISAQKGIAASGAAAADATGDMAKATEGAGKASKKAAKDMRGVLAGFDELNVLAAQTADSVESAAGGVGGLGDMSGDALDLSGIETGGELFGDVTVNPEIAAFIERIKAALEPTIAALGRLWEELQRLAGFAWQGLQGFYENFLEPIGHWVFNEAIPRFVDALTNGLALINWNLILDSLNRLWKALEPFAENVGEGLLWLWENILVPFGTWTMNNAVPLLLDGIAAALTIFNAIWGAVQPGLEWLWGNFLEPIASWTGGVIVAVLGGIVDALEAFGVWASENKETIQDIVIIIGSFFAAWGIVNLAQTIYGIVTALVTFITTGGLAAAATTAFGVAVNFLLSPVTLVIVAIGALIAIVVLLAKHWEEIKEVAAKVWEGIQTAWNSAGEWFSKTVVEPIAQFFLDLWSSISNLANKAWEGVSHAWNAAGEWFNTAIIQPVQQFFEGLWTTVQTAAQACWTAVSGLWATVSGWFNTNVVQPVSQFFSGLWTGISTWASDAWRNITDVFGKAADWFQSTIIDPVSNGFKGFFNGLIGFAEGFVNFFIRGINQLIGALNGMSFSAPDWVPFIGGKRFGLDIPSASELRLPRLANGAVIPPNSQFLAVLGDQRRGTNIEAPLSTIEQALRNVLASTGGQGGDVTVNFTIDLDSREIYRGQKRVSRQLGSGLVGGLA